MVKIIVVKAEQKKPQHYRKCSNIGQKENIYPKNHHVINVYSVSYSEMASIRSHDEDALENLANRLREKGFTDEVVIKICLGGPGRRKSHGETKSEWLSKRQSGMPEIARLRL